MKNLPATFVEAEALPIIERWYDVIKDKMTTEAFRARLLAYMREQIESGTVPTMQAIEAAEKGDPYADTALRVIGVEMLDRGEMPPTALRNYTQKSVFRPRTSFPRGGDPIANTDRDIGISILVSMTAERWGLDISQNEASKSKGRHSACSLVAQALTNRGQKISEKTVGTIHRERNKIAEKIAAAIQL